MSCNYDITKVNKLFNLAVQYYPKKKLAHALRVAEYATAKASALKMDTVKTYMIALAHDLLEDTECPKEDLMSILGIESYNSVVLLTKDVQEKYEDYIHKIIDAKEVSGIMANSVMDGLGKVIGFEDSDHPAEQGSDAR